MTVAYSGGCPRGGEPVQFDQQHAIPGMTICVARSSCQPPKGIPYAPCPSDDDGVEGPDDDIHEYGEGHVSSWIRGNDMDKGYAVVRSIDGKGYFFVAPDGRPGLIDYYGRWFASVDAGVYTNESFPINPEYGKAFNAVPLMCAPTPSQTPPPPAPTPVDHGIPPQPADFRLNFVNGCDKLKLGANGCGHCDSTDRYIGTLADGTPHGDACDDDHMRCAVEPERCKANPGDIPKHLKTWEMCGGQAWDSSTGTDFRITGATSWHVSEENPFAAEICADHGAEITVETCLPLGARTKDGRAIPGGPGCQKKTFKAATAPPAN